MATAELESQQRVAALYSDHHGWLFGWLRKKLGCAHNAADVAHDTFVRIIASRDVMFGVQEPRAYLTTAAKHLLANRARRQLIEQAYLEELAHAANQVDGYPSPEQIYAAMQALEQISDALQGLAVKPRQAFLLHYLDDLTQSEVAASLGVSTRMVQKYLAQALLHCHLAAEGLGQ
ncbi:sigma-70 family RNA polymerase sigma factor [Duganella sp. FT80W]|uniref:Sigma-70 family RNA polymerase sigma factor n=1 Tax=Duganella guangzhouensis TaxID=2666084 RepID=A0A6I2KV16_9BURK|nr:sigma-70 family RNA polymerase sigma factor [Duganella guangzhouensis]MRW89758.1 sigma-70 family RNA polymerase sigma factor [Duganella guangzhouensis]